MAIEVNEERKETLIRNIKDCGQSLIDNAEKMVVDYKYRCGLTITCYVDEEDRAPYISVDTPIIPENFVERLMGVEID